jgi:hypothetical protein
MSDQIALDLYIQDFVNTNKLLGQHFDWVNLVNRRFMEDGLIKVFSFQSGGQTHLAVGQRLLLPDSDWFRIELTRPIPAVSEHRFECLRMLHQSTHYSMTVEHVGGEKRMDEEVVAPGTATVLVKLLTRHRGMLNCVFVIRDSTPLDNPFLV